MLVLFTGLFSLASNMFCGVWIFGHVKCKWCEISFFLVEFDFSGCVAMTHLRSHMVLNLLFVFWVCWLLYKLVMIGYPCFGSKERKGFLKWRTAGFPSGTLYPTGFLLRNLSCGNHFKQKFGNQIHKLDVAYLEKCCQCFCGFWILHYPWAENGDVSLNGVEISISAEL